MNIIANTQPSLPYLSNSIMLSLFPSDKGDDGDEINGNDFITDLRRVGDSHSVVILSNAILKALTDYMLTTENDSSCGSYGNDIKDMISSKLVAASVVCGYGCIRKILDAEIWKGKLKVNKKSKVKSNAI